MTPSHNILFAIAGHFRESKGLVPRYRRGSVLAYFPVAVTKYSNKSNSVESGFISAYGARYLLWKGNQGSKSFTHPQSESLGNGDVVLPSHFNTTLIIPCRNAQRPISQTIAYSAKLTALLITEQPRRSLYRQGEFSRCIVKTLWSNAIH